MKPTTLTLTPAEKNDVLRISVETLVDIATNPEIRFLLFPRDENEITFIGLRFLSNQYAILGRELPGRLGEIAKSPSRIYFAQHREIFPEMYNGLGDYIGYPFESESNPKTA
jgi:hypothetical protein